MQNLSILRRQKKITQQQMADILQVSKPTYNHYESGRYEPSLAMLIKLADFFEVSVDYLLDHQTTQIVHLDSYTEKQQKAIGLMQKLNDDEMLVLLGYLARITNTPLEEVLQKKV